MKKLANTIKSFEERFKLARAFTISRGTKTHAHVVRVEISDGEFKGQGECVPYARYGESVESVREQISELPTDIDRLALQDEMPAGAARNAVDCALWDLEAKRSGMPVWQLAGLTRPGKVETAYTISLEAPKRMLEAARRNSDRPLLKVKLGTPDDIERLQAVRDGAPNSQIIVDANEGWKLDDFRQILPALKQIDVKLIEQPVAEVADQVLEGETFDIPLCADESCHTSEQLERLAEKYQFVNIKLDKAGGLTEALKMLVQARALGLGTFVGCMVGSSLAMAPAILLAQSADYVDLDGPLLLAEDRINGLQYEGSDVYPPETELWG